MNAPTVQHIDISGYRGRAGDTIAIRAVDDFSVTKVSVQIRNAAGTLIEEGEAAKGLNCWRYRVTVPNLSISGSTIRATAFDRPGNTGISVAHIS